MSETKLYIDELEPTTGQDSKNSGEAAVQAETVKAEATTGSQEAAEAASSEKAISNGSVTQTTLGSQNMASEEAKQGAEAGQKRGAIKISKKTWILIAVLAVVAIGAIVTAVLMLGGDKSSNRPNKVPDTNVSDNGDGDAGDEDQDKGDETEIITLSTGDARVQKLYGYFLRVSFASELGQLADFYTNRGSFSGELSDLMMVDLAMANLEAGQCALPATEENLLQRYADWMGSDEQMPSTEMFQAMYNAGCYSGQAVRDKVKEIFGKDLKLTPELLAQAGDFWGYDAGSDEIYATNIGRGGVFPVFNRNLLKAERDGERMYLYENVSVALPGETELISLYDKCLLAQDQETYEQNGCGAEDYEWQTGETKFRLVFKRTDAGNYVFEKLERAERA